MTPEDILQITPQPLVVSGYKHLRSFHCCRRQAAIAVNSMAQPLQHTTDQLNSTALKWGRDGELSDLDLQRILTLMSQADPVAEALVSSRFEG